MGSVADGAVDGSVGRTVDGVVEDDSGNCWVVVPDGDASDAGIQPDRESAERSRDKMPVRQRIFLKVVPPFLLFYGKQFLVYKGKTV